MNLTSKSCRAASAKGKGKEKGKSKPPVEGSAKNDAECGLGYAALAAQKKGQKRPAGTSKAGKAKDEEEVQPLTDLKEPCSLHREVQHHIIIKSFPQKKEVTAYL